MAQINLATGGVTGRQAGSTFKPFALVAAMLNGIPPQQVYDAPPFIDIPLPRECQAPDEPTWAVSNFDGTGEGQMTIEQATIDSVNVVYAQLVRDLGGGDACVGAFLAAAIDGHDHDMRGRELGWQHQAVVIAVHHGEGAN